MEGMNEDYILESIFKLRTENTEVHDRIIEYFTNQYDEYSQSSEDDVSEGVKDFSTHHLQTTDYIHHID